MSVFLSDIELYYTISGVTPQKEILLSGNELKHAIKVMRHTAGDTIYATDGNGLLYKAEIRNIHSEFCTALIKEEHIFSNKLKDIYFCIPILKNPDRFEFAIEKCTEIGITNFIVYHANRSAPKGDKVERWKKILLSAMKQSLRCFLPEIKVVSSLEDITILNGKHLLFEQKGGNFFDTANIQFESSEKQYFIFGPEGGLDENELGLINSTNHYSLSKNRLRSETAIILTASAISHHLNKNY